MASTSKRNGQTLTREKEAVDLGLKESAVEGVVTCLTQALADTEVLYVKTMNVHWNIVDPNFYGIHTLLDEQYNSLKVAGGKIAERIRTYGVPVIGSMREFLAHTRLGETKGDQVVQVAALKDLISDHEALIRQLRQDIERCTEDYGDQGAADLLIARLQGHQEMSWMLRASLPH